jgi:hypothetical protein
VTGACCRPRERRRYLLWLRREEISEIGDGARLRDGGVEGATDTRAGRPPPAARSRRAYRRGRRLAWRRCRIPGRTGRQGSLGPVPAR